MYYSYRCSYCSRVFYTFNDDKTQASRKLYSAIKQHLIDYDEDRKESEFDGGKEIDSNEVYAAIGEYSERPSGGYEV